MRRFFVPGPATGLVVLALSAPVFADPPAVSAPRSAANAEVALIDGWAEADGSRVAGVEIRIDPGWHTYWRVPGEAGIPPSFDWSGSRNLASVRYEWPRPEIIESYGLRSYGYFGALVLPVLLTPKDPSAPIEAALALSFGVCNDICTQEDRHLAASFAGGDGAGRGRIEAALAERARTAGEAGVADVTCGIDATGDGYALTATVTFERPQPAGQSAVLETSQAGLWIGEAESVTDGATVIARAPIAGREGAGPVLERKGVRLTVLDDARAVDIRGCTGRPG